MPRRLLLAVLVVVLVAGAACGAWWLHLAGMVRERILAWADTERARAGLVEYSDLEIHGFPFRLTAEARAIRIVRPDGTQWRGDGVAATARPWNPGAIAVVLSGTHALALPGAEAVAAGGEGAILLEGGRFASGRLRLHDVELSLPDGRFQATGLDLAAVPAGPAVTGVSIAVAELVLPEGLGMPLGRTLDSAGIEAVIEGPLPDRIDPAAIRAWAERGGALRIDRAGLRWGPLGLAGDGRIAFDAALRPSGDLRTEIEGTEPVLDALAAAGTLGERDTAIARTALGLLTRRRAADGMPVVAASMTMRDGWLQLGPLRLLPLPPLDVLLGGVRPASPR
jgi:hypothetical protein